MQVSDAATSPLATNIGVGTGRSKYTDLVTQYANTLADGSTASLDDKLTAWTNLTSLMFTRNESGGILYQTNKSDYQRAADIYENSDFAKQMQQVDYQFNAASYSMGVSQAGTETNAAQNNLDILSRFSQDQQKMIFVALRMNVPGSDIVGDQDIYYANLGDWKSALTQQAAAFNAQQQASAATALSTASATAASSASPASIATLGLTTPPIASRATNAASQPAATSPAANNATTTNARIAVQLMLETQDTMQKSDAEAQTTKIGASAFAAPQASSVFRAQVSEALATSSGSRVAQTA